MFGAFRSQRALRCLGGAWDPEALLLSVLRLQTPSAQTEQIPPLDASTLIRNSAEDAASTATRVSRGDSSRASVPQPCGASCEPVFVTATAAAGSSDQALNVYSKGGPAAAPTSQCPSPMCGAAAHEATTELCFTLVAARASPGITFPEMLMQWENFVAGYGAHYTELLAPQLRRREAALLNIKLADPVLGQLAVLSAANSPPGGVSKYIAQVLRTDLLRQSKARRCGAAKSGWESGAACGCYGLPHFAAELGDMGYLDALLREFPRGFPLRWLSSPESLGLCDGGAGTEAGRTTLSADTFDSAAGMLPISDHQLHQPPQQHHVELYPFEHVAATCPDHIGYYVGHYACFHGHIAFVQFLIRMLGASFVLEEQRCAAPISADYTWGAQRYICGLNGTQCAVAGQQVALLEWIGAEHPSALHSLGTRTTVNALIIAAMLSDHRTDVFHFFRAHNLFPLGDLASPPSDGIPAQQVSEREEVGGLRHRGFLNSAAVQILFAAAEAGNCAVLKWFDDALGTADVRLVCDEQGATVLHHCARGCNVAMLEALLCVPAASNTASTAGGGEPQWPPLDPFWVDVEDVKGRTAAMWCVMGATRGRGVVETLEVLRRAGSDWPRTRRGGLSLLDIATRFMSRHSKTVRYLRTHTHLASPAATGSTP